MELKSIDAMSMAKIFAAWYAALGLVYGVFFLFLGGIVAAAGGGYGALAGMGFAGLIVFPLGFGIIGFIFGGLTAVMYNFAAKRVGGLKLNLR